MSEPVNRTRRQARICPQHEKGCNWRSFGEPDAVCPEHGRGVDQADKVYNPNSGSRGKGEGVEGAPAAD